MKSTRVEYHDQSKDGTRMAMSSGSDHWSLGRYLRGVLGGRQEPGSLKFLRGTLRFGDWRLGQLVLVPQGVSLQNRDQGAGETRTYSIDRHGDLGAGSKEDVASGDHFNTAGEADLTTGKIAIQITRDEAATTILRSRMINIARAASVFLTGNILVVGSVYGFFLKRIYGVQLSPHQNVLLALALVVTHIGGMLTVWIMRQVQVEDVISV